MNNPVHVQVQVVKFWDLKVKKEPYSNLTQNKPTDKTAKFRECPANFVSLPDNTCMSDKKLTQKNAQTVF